MLRPMSSEGMHVPQARSTRCGLTTAVITVLAVTVSASVLAAPAHSFPIRGVVTAEATEVDSDLIAYPQDSELSGAGVTGFLTFGPDGTSTWRRYADGSVQATYEEAAYVRSTRTTDFLVTWEPSRIAQQNMSTHATLEVPVGEASGGAKYAGAAGDALFTTLVTELGTVLRRHTAALDIPAPVTGLPADAIALKVEPGTPDHAVVTFVQGGKSKWGFLNLATGAVTEIHDSAVAAEAVSATHTAWVVGEETNLPPQVFASNRATGAVQKVPVIQQPTFGSFHIGLVGDWVVSGQSGGMAQSRASAHYPLTAYNLTTKTSVKLFDHAYQLAPSPDGSLYVRGGGVGKGEGMYRVSDAGTTAPKVEKVATTGRPTEIVAANVTIPPAVVDLDRTDDVGFRWTLSRRTQDVTLTVRHVRTGTTSSVSAFSAETDVRLYWRGSGEEAPHNGDYTWQLTARPDNGIGPAAVLKGSFKVVRKSQPHDFNDNGTPDLITRDTSGRLWRTDLIYRPIDSWGRIDEGSPKSLLGSGWNIYDRIEAAGNLGGSAVGDLLARDKSGVLWLYQGTGTGSFATRVKVGNGWNTYDKITAGSDLTGDGRTDALATDRTGVLWLYSGTGNVKSPFTTRKKIGGGWGDYNDITATGNLAGGPAGDLVARDKAGTLWQYLGKGDGTFAPRTRIGGGWNSWNGFDAIIGAGDADGDGHPDLIGTDTLLDVPKLYKGTGDWKAPLHDYEVMYLDYDRALNLTL
ncbi:FG-GAP repeat domain-containing protein [Streptomyces sp. NPDC056374]|uniref:FG-GAP repeat domain-containing protein n=1 Tax=unclassified Streptomyces TaxID=2593676 RepID=UPI0035E03AA8